MKSPNRVAAFLNYVVLALLFGFVATSPVFGADNPIPFVNAPLIPAAVAPGGAAFTLTVTGTGFTAGSVVNWNGTPRATTFVSASKLTALILAADIQFPTTASVTVTNPTPGGGSSSPQFFQVANPAPFTAVAKQLAGNVIPNAPVVVADVNRDGKEDVIYVGFPISGGGTGSLSTICVLLGNGNGTFTEGTFFGGPVLDPNFAPQIIAGDFNNDGKVDIVSLAQGLILLGNGDGTFTPSLTVPVKLNQGVIGDFNGDGKLDIVGYAPFPDAKLYILNGNGDGTFTQSTIFDFGALGAGTSIQALTTGDTDGDGSLDLIVAAGNVFLLKGKGDGTFNSPTQIPGADAGRGLALADLNGEGKLDLIIGRFSAVEILLGNGDGTFGSPTSLSVSQPPTVGNILLGDFNGDGILDFNFSNVIFFGKGDGTFPTSVVVPNFISGGNAAADFDGDGKLDLLGATPFFLSLAMQQSPPTGDFTGTVDPQVLTVRAGVAGTYNLNLIPLNGFHSDINLSVTGLPVYNHALGTPQFTFHPVSGTVIGGSGPATLTVFTSSETLPGTYNVTISGTTPTTPSIAHSAAVTLVVLPFGPDFTGSLTNNSALVQSGNSATYGITVIPINGFTGSVQLNVTDLPPGASASFSPNPVTGGSGSSILTISTATSTPTGRFYPQITGTSGSLTHSTKVILDVNSAADFTGDLQPRQQTVIRGSSASFSGRVVALSGFTGAVALSASGLPANVTAAFAPPSVTGSGPYTLTISAGASAVPGTYPVTVTGTSNGVSHSLMLTLTIQ